MNDLAITITAAVSGECKIIPNLSHAGYEVRQVEAPVAKHEPEDQRGYLEVSACCQDCPCRTALAGEAGSVLLREASYSCKAQPKGQRE